MGPFTLARLGTVPLVGVLTGTLHSDVASLFCLAHRFSVEEVRAHSVKLHHRNTSRFVWNDGEAIFAVDKTLKAKLFLSQVTDSSTRWRQDEDLKSTTKAS